MKLLSATFVCFILYCTDDETFVCNFTLPVALSRLSYAFAFVNMVLTEDDESVVPLCLIVIALAMQHFNGPRITRSCKTRRWIQRRKIYGAHHALLEELRYEDPKSLQNF